MVILAAKTSQHRTSNKCAGEVGSEFLTAVKGEKELEQTPLFLPSSLPSLPSFLLSFLPSAVFCCSNETGANAFKTLSLQTSQRLSH